MNQGIQVIVCPVHDVAKAKATYRALLGTEPYVDQAYYVGFRVGDTELGLDPNGHRTGLTGPVGYWKVDDLEQSIAALTAAGATVRQPAKGVGGTRRVAILADADGNPIGLMQD